MNEFAVYPRVPDQLVVSAVASGGRKVVESVEFGNVVPAVGVVVALPCLGWRVLVGAFAHP